MLHTKHLLGYAFGLALSLGISSSACSAASINLIASGYTNKGGEGVYGFSFNVATNQFGPVQLLTKNHNPSFGLHNNNLWYFVDETTEGQLLTYAQNGKGEAKNSKGEFSLLQTLPVMGADPCYISKRKDGKYLAVANYSSGNLAVFALDAKGVPQANPQIKQQQGTGPVSDRQQAAHAHWAGWAQLADKTTGLYAVDLGADKIFWYPQNAQGILGDAQVAYSATPGDGPRHLAIHPHKPWVYVVNELNNSLSFTQQDASGHLTLVQKVSSLPADFHGKNTAAHIVISADGKHIYTSNRGDLNSISVFNIGDDGRPTLVQNISSQGKTPRFFLLLEDAKKLLIANQDSDNLVVMSILANGQLEYSGVQAQVPRPTFLAVE